MRGRGLKPAIVLPFSPGLTVAPYAGAWIETCEGVILCTTVQVAPYAGAWIETCRATGLPIKQAPSPLMRGRGLKHTSAYSLQVVQYVAPYAGAWIETIYTPQI